jgi:hypothetical protein
LKAKLRLFTHLLYGKFAIFEVQKSVSRETLHEHGAWKDFKPHWSLHAISMAYVSAVAFCRNFGTKLSDSESSETG